MGMSGDRPSRRYDVVAETRRRWSEAEKRAIVEEASAACTNVSAVARRHGMKPSLLFRWKRDFGAAGPKPCAFVPMALAAPERPMSLAGSLADAEPAGPAVSRSDIEIELANGRRLRVGTKADMAALKRIIAILEE